MAGRRYKRLRVAGADTRPTDLEIAILSVGTGINHMPDAELRELWERHGAWVTRYCRETFDCEPFVGMLARTEKWPVHAA